MAETFHITTFSKTQFPLKSQKTPLVLIHGWGLNSAVWQPFIDSLPDDFTNEFDIVTLDLPGFGLNIDKEIKPYSLANICEHIVNTITQPAVYLGWSLGGLVATEMALRHPNRVLGLITVASSPCFLEQTNDDAQAFWPGIKATVLDSFHQQLQVDTKKTISGFLKIQAMGSPHIRHDIKQISQLVFQHPMASRAILDLSLKLLETSDFRTQIASIQQPFLRLYGDTDSLVPKAVIEPINKLAQNSEQHTFTQASHAPFISHPNDFREVLTNWLIKRFRSV